MRSASREVQVHTRREVQVQAQVQAQMGVLRIQSSVWFSVRCAVGRWVVEKYKFKYSIFSKGAVGRLNQPRN